MSILNDMNQNYNALLAARVALQHAYDGMSADQLDELAARQIIHDIAGLVRAIDPNQFKPPADIDSVEFPFSEVA